MASKLLSAQCLLQAISDENISQAATLLIEGACPNLLLPAEGASPFHLAVGCDSRHALQLTTLFLQYNADPNVRSTEGLTPVHVAASWGRFQALELLLWNGGDPSLEDEDGKTAKNMAESSGHWDCINLLDTWINNQDDTDQEEEEAEGQASFLEIPFASQDGSNDIYGSVGSPSSLPDHVMLNIQSPDKHGPFNNNGAAYSWSPGSATSSTLGSMNKEFSSQCLEEDATDCDLHDYEISFPKQQRVTSCSPSLQSSYDEMSLNRALLSMNIDSYSLSSRVSDRSSSSSMVSPSLSKTSPIQYDEHSEGDASPRQYDVHSEGEASPSQYEVHSEGEASPSQYDVHSEGDASPSQYDVHSEGEASPSQYDVHSEGEASPSRYDVHSEGEASPSHSDLHSEGEASPSQYDVHSEGEASPSHSDLHYEGEASLSENEHTLTGFGLDVTSPDHTVVFSKATAKDRRRTVFCPLQYPSLEFEEREDFPSPHSITKRNINEEEQSSFGSGKTEDSLSPCSTAESNAIEEQQTVPEACEASSLSSYHTACSPDSSLSSNMSSRSIYCNRKSGASLIEDHFLPASGSEPSLLNFSFATADDTIVYDWTSFKSDSCEEDVPQRVEIPPELAKLTNDELKVKLSDLGEDVGPVTTTTRSVYLSFLVKLMQDNGATLKRSKPKPDSCNINFQYELAAVMNGNKPLPDGLDLERQMVEQWEEPDPKRKWREGKLKSSFNYLLLDPRVTRDLPSRYPKLTQLETFKTFVSAIFYVGKGKRSRPYAHFEEALDHLKKKMTKKPGAKVLHILDVWSGGMGVVSLHCFQNVIPVEAYTREACMMDALGLSRLTNAKRGDYYGVAHSWSGSKKRKVGVHLLHKACQIFLMEGERQIRSADITSGQ